jgi:hypothetical protein
MEKYPYPHRGQGLVLKDPPPFSPMPLGNGESFKKIWGRSATMNQGQTSQCVWFTWAGRVMSEPHRVTVSLSRANDMYREMQRNDGIPGEEPDYFGTTLEAGHLIFKREGLVEPEPVVATRLSQVLECLRTRGPVCMGTEWRFGMAHPNTRGEVNLAGANLGGHAWLVIGADTERQVLYCLNSHGASYGLRGMFIISFKDFETLLRVGGYGLSAIQKAA